MSIGSQTRQNKTDKAATFRKKSVESFLSARESLRNDRYRTTCNRAYYCVYQLINAVAFEKLPDEPPGGKQNWDHSDLDWLLKSLAVRTNFLKEVGRASKLARSMSKIQILKNFRNAADYRHPDNQVTKESAQGKLDDALNLRKFILSIVGEQDNEISN